MMKPRCAFKLVVSSVLGSLQAHDNRFFANALSFLMKITDYVVPAEASKLINKSSINRI
jgi:hypothetical protein